MKFIRLARTAAQFEIVKNDMTAFPMVAQFESTIYMNTVEGKGNEQADEILGPGETGVPTQRTDTDTQLNEILGETL